LQVLPRFHNYFRQDGDFVIKANSGKVTKGQRPMLNRNFLLIQKLSWGLFTPKRNTGVN